jgi:hypothetical protein
MTPTPTNRSLSTRPLIFSRARFFRSNYLDWDLNVKVSLRTSGGMGGEQEQENLGQL